MEGRLHGVPAPWETAVLEWIPDGVVVVDHMGRIVYANRQTERLTGYRRGELLGRLIELFVPSSLRGLHREERRSFAAQPRSRPMGPADRDFRLRRKDGSEIVADIALAPIGRPVSGYTVAAIRDATERRRLERDLEQRALHDPLTGLANRTLFFDRLNQAMLAFKRDRRPVAVVMLDLDRFKTVNDAFGHLAGDGILRELAVQLSAGLRSTDTVARLGGDEFAWILPNVAGSAAAVRRVRALLRAVARDYSIDGQQIEVGLSAGMALFPADGAHADGLMRHADLALYTAKRQGGGLALVDRRGRGARERQHQTKTRTRNR
jgi:diguanylate cyclase (GGDEF)-like protein/PAS domain S-box-containing protein